MLRGFLAHCLVAAALLLSRPASADPEIKLPPGTRKDPAGHYTSGRGLRDSTDFIAKELSRAGIATHQVGPYRVRGVEVTRFLAQSASTSWLAIHVLRISGKTMIFFVPRPKP